MLKIIGMALICAVMGTVGQVFWKTGLQRMDFAINPAGVLAVARSWHMWAGAGCFMVAVLVWFVLLSRADLSQAMPLTSLSFIFGLIASRLILGEAVSVTRWLGVLVICAGVYLVSRR